ncbi:MAG: hypothetical protein Q9180_001441 [Flavoplaca navasiana]
MFTHWLNLPNEILDNILHHVPDLPTLANLVQVHPVHQQLFIQRYSQIMVPTLKRSLPKQFQKIAATIQSLRYGSLSPNRLPRLDPFLILNVCLENTDQDCQLDVLDDPLSALTDIAWIYNDSEYWTKKLLNSRCRQPQIVDEQNSYTLNPASSVTQVELYRIQRAFWRFELLSNLASCETTTQSAVPFNIRQRTTQHIMNPHKHLPFSTDPLCVRDPPSRLWNFQKTLTHWEAEELECVYYFFVDEYECHMKNAKLANTDGDTKTTLVIQQSPEVRRLLLTMGFKPRAIAPKSLDSGDRRTSLDRRFFTYRLMHTRQVRTVWSDAPLGALSSNDGYKCWYNNRDNQDWDIESLEAPSPDCTDPDRGPVVCFLRWGYCMWDAQRLLDWGILPSSQYGKPNWRLWSCGDHGGELCVHLKCRRKGREGSLIWPGWLAPFRIYDYDMELEFDST